MLGKIRSVLFLGLACCFMCVSTYADEFDDMFIEEEEVVAPIKTDEEISTEALEAYEVEGSLFEKITTLEQEKMVMQLEADRIKMDLELDRLNKERMKIQMELEDLVGRAAQQQQELETAKANLEAQAEQLKKQREALEKKASEPQPQYVVVEQEVEPEPQPKLVSKYRLINVIGVGNQLQATLEELSTGQNKRISVGKKLDGYTIKSISLNEGIVFEKDGVVENLNVGR